mmetsp:Transcript_18297/g.24134  ORF Transcript_18297/g.24134 Transcript_18297/m.24134 type:complete len:103 (-) Transcript_18297:309-617(-)
MMVNKQSSLMVLLDYLHQVVGVDLTVLIITSYLATCCLQQMALEHQFLAGSTTYPALVVNILHHLYIIPTITRRLTLLGHHMDHTTSSTPSLEMELYIPSSL